MDDFYIADISDELFAKMKGKSYKDDCTVPIDHDDLAFKLFTEAGFTWGGDWEGRKDYQHFEISKDKVL